MMNSHWGHLYDRFKDRRYGRLFLVVWFGVVIGLLVAARLSENFFTEHPSRTGEIVVAMGLVLMFVPFLRAAVDFFFRNRRRRGRGQNCSRLSSDEMLKARSKLRNTIKVLRPPEPQAPDLDLKY